MKCIIIVLLESLLLRTSLLNYASTQCNRKAEVEVGVIIASSGIHPSKVADERVVPKTLGAEQWRRGVGISESPGGVEAHLR